MVDDAGRSARPAQSRLKEEGIALGILWQGVEPVPEVPLHDGRLLFDASSEQDALHRIEAVVLPRTEVA